MSAQSSQQVCLAANNKLISLDSGSQLAQPPHTYCPFLLLFQAHSLSPLFKAGIIEGEFVRVGPKCTCTAWLMTKREMVPLLTADSLISAWQFVFLCAVLRRWIVQTIKWNILAVVDCLQQQSDGQAWLNTWLIQTSTVRWSSAVPGDQVSTSTFYLKIYRVESALCWLQWQIKWNWQRVGCLPWHSQAVAHHACSKCILLADVQERNEKMSSSITIFPQLCT